MLSKLKMAISKKDKPIMTKEKHDNYLTLSENEQLKILDGLSTKNKKRIGEWLDTVEVKKDDYDEQYIASPFRGIIYINKDISYANLYKWCLANFEKIKLARLPKPLDDKFFYYANKWKKKPNINPFTNKEIIVSLNPNGEYVSLYKEFINGLVRNILKARIINVLTVEECYKIKDSLPNEHSYVFSDRSKDSKYQIIYDYLFIVYFIKSNTFRYDPAFQNDLNIYIDLAIYNTSQFIYNDNETNVDFHYTTEFLYIRKFYKNYLQNMSDSELSISNLIMKLCIDIENILEYMRESQETKITSTVIDNVNYNMKVLKYCKEIFSKVPIDYFREYIKNPDKKNDREVLKEYLLLILTNHEKNISVRFKNISDSIMDYMEDEELPASNVFETLLSIYNNILKLYRNNKKIPSYKNYIKDPYNINKGIEPQIPVKKQLPRELQIYKIRLNNLKNAAKSKSSNEKKLREFEENNLLNERKLKEFEENMKNHDKKMKKYIFNKDVYDRIYEGKYTPKKHMELLSLNAYNRLKKDETIPKVSNRKAKSDGNYISIGKIHHNEYYGKTKAFTTISDKNKRINSSNNSSNNSNNNSDKISGYYKNDIDPYTQEEFSDMNPKKRKYASDIIYKNGTQEFHYRFDTISIYNYILKCIEVCETPINFFNRSELTDDDLDEICNKIKHFTKKPTYNSSSEIRPLLDEDCSKYNNHLEFEWWEYVKDKDIEKGIIGNIKIYISIKLGNILFKINEEKVLELPIFNSNKSERLSYNILELLQDKLSKGELTGNKYFPYRKNKTFLKLPEFTFELTDNAEKTLERLKRYKHKLEQL
jgi:hypothetical protein